VQYMSRGGHPVGEGLLLVRGGRCAVDEWGRASSGRGAPFGEKGKVCSR